MTNFGEEMTHEDQCRICQTNACVHMCRNCGRRSLRFINYTLTCETCGFSEDNNISFTQEIDIPTPVTSNIVSNQLSESVSMFNGSWRDNYRVSTRPRQLLGGYLPRTNQDNNFISNSDDIRNDSTVDEVSAKSTSFCVDCELSVCKACYINHDGHTITSLDDPKNSFKAYKACLYSRCTGSVQNLLRTNEVIEDREESLENHYNSFKDDLEATYERRVKELREETDAMQQEATQAKEMKIQLLKTQQNGLERSCSSLIRAISELRMSTIEESPCSRINNALEVGRTCLTHSQIHSNLLPAVSDTCQLWTSHLPGKSLRSFIGFVQTGCYGPYTKIEGIGTKSAMFGNDCSFKIIAFDHNEQRKLDGGDDFTVTVEQADNVMRTCRVRDRRDGTYIATYTPSDMRNHTLTVKCAGVTIREPHIVKIKPTVTIDMLNSPGLTFKNPKFDGVNPLVKPYGLYVDEIGFIYLLDRGTHKVIVLDDEGNYQFDFGGFGHYPGKFDRPCAMTFDYRRQMIIVVDKDNHRVQFFNESGEFLSAVGKRGDKDIEFCYPWDIDRSERMDVLALSDSRNKRVAILDAYGKIKYSIGGVAGAKHVTRMFHPGIFDTPRGVRFVPDSSKLCISDFNGNKVIVYDLKTLGSPPTTIAYEGSGLGQLSRPQGMLFDYWNRLYVTDSKNVRIQVFNDSFPTFKATATFGEQNFHAGLMKAKRQVTADGRRPNLIHSKVSSMAFSPDGTLIVMDSETFLVHILNGTQWGGHRNFTKMIE